MAVGRVNADTYISEGVLSKKFVLQFWKSSLCYGILFVVFHSTYFNGKPEVSR